MEEIIDIHNDKIVKNIGRDKGDVTVYFTDGSYLYIEDMGDTWGLEVESVSKDKVINH